MPEQMGAELLARQMVKEGVEDLFYIMGGPIIETAGFAAEHGIRTIDCRHEQGAAMAAHGYARVKRVPGVCLAASGPATTNLLTGVANAYLDCVPMVALGGAAAFSSFERDDFQEYDQLAMAQPVTRWASRVTHSWRMPEFFNLAYRKAQGPKVGPTYLDLPGDTLYQKFDDEGVWFPESGGERPRPGADPDDVKRAIELLANADRPIVMSGSGIVWSGAAAELKEFVETTGIPFWTTPQGRGAIPEDHELCFLGARSMAFSEADVALVVGTRLNFVIGSGRPPRWAPDLKVIHIDVDPSEVNHNKEAAVGIVADAKRALVALTAEAKAAGVTGRKDWIGRLSEADESRKTKDREFVESDETPIHPLRLADEIVQRMDRDAIVCVDGNATLAFARQYIPSFVDGARLNPGPNGCMGVGLPFVLGAKAAAPNRQVVGFVGDGSFLMNVQEIDTMVRHDLPATIVICNNGGWTAGTNETPGRTLGFKQRYEDLAVALGGHGEHVTKPEEIGPAIERAMASGKAAVVNVEVEEHAMPGQARYGGYSATLSR